MYPSSEQGVAIWNLKRNEVELEFEVPKPKRPFGPLAFSPDGRLVAAVCVSEEPRESSIVVWDLEKNAKAHEITRGGGDSRNVWIAPPRISPDNRRLATGTIQGELAVFRLDDEQEELRLDHGSAVRLVGWMGNDRLWSAGTMALKEWELAVARPLRTLRTKSPGEFGNTRFTFSRDGRWMAVAARREVQMFHWPSGKLHRTLEGPFKSLLGMNLGARGEQAVVSGIQLAAAYDMETGEQLFKDEQGNYMGAGVTDDGRALFLKSDGTQLSVTQYGRDELVWESSGKIPPGVSRLATISPDGRRLATWLLSFQKNKHPASLEIWDLSEGGKMHEPSDVGDSLITAQFNAHGNSLVTIDMNNLMARIGMAGSNVKATARVWDAESGAKLLEIHGPQMMSFAISQDGRLLAIQFRDHRIEVWNVPAQEQLFNWALPGRDPSLVRATEIAFTPDGRYLAAAVGSGQIQMLDLLQVRNELKNVGLGW